jgi:hypothetical protein
MSALFSKPLSVLNEGLASFADAIEGRGGAATRGRDSEVEPSHSVTSRCQVCYLIQARIGRLEAL